jgi:hypothetical protein
MDGFGSIVVNDPALVMERSARSTSVVRRVHHYKALNSILDPLRFGFHA